jgi:hypothetical protein
MKKKYINILNAGQCVSSVILDGGTPTNGEKGPLSTTWIYIIIAASVGSVIICFIIYCACKQCREERRRRYERQQAVLRQRGMIQLHLGT